MGQGKYRTAMRITSKKIKQYINKRAKNNTWLQHKRNCRRRRRGRERVRRHKGRRGVTEHDYEAKGNTKQTQAKEENKTNERGINKSAVPAVLLQRCLWALHRTQCNVTTAQRDKRLVTSASATKKKIYIEQPIY